MTISVEMNDILPSQSREGTSDDEDEHPDEDNEARQNNEDHQLE